MIVLWQTFLNFLDHHGYLDIERINDLTKKSLEAAIEIGIKAATFTINHKGAVFPRSSDL